MSKKKLDIYTATGCQACENGILDIHFHVSPLSRWTEFCFWPYVMGSRWEDLDDQGPIDICFFAGAIRTEDDRKAALMLRERSRFMVASGACSAFGGIPGLQNLSPNGADAPTESESADEPGLPSMQTQVSALSGTVEVDYQVPGCPPTQQVLWAALQALLCPGEKSARLSFAASRLSDTLTEAVTSGSLPPRGSTFAGDKAVCASCSRAREEKKFRKVHRPHLIEPDTGKCLLEQGLVCQGLATREGCGGVCTAAGAGCRGCFGKAGAIFDPGAKMVSAITSTVDSTNATEIESISSEFIDLAGTFYRYTVPTQCVLLANHPKESTDARDDH